MVAILRRKSKERACKKAVVYTNKRKVNTATSSKKRNITKKPVNKKTKPMTKNTRCIVKKEEDEGEVFEGNIGPNVCTTEESAEPDWCNARAYFFEKIFKMAISNSDYVKHWKFRCDLRHNDERFDEVSASGYFRGECSLIKKNFEGNIMWTTEFTQFVQKKENDKESSLSNTSVE